MALRVFAVVLLCAVRAPAVSGPDDRRPTKPETIAAPFHANAAPVPVDDLFYTRSVTNPAWSPETRGR
jgi:hypothetical protein